MSDSNVTKLLHGGPENVRGRVYTSPMSENECECFDCTMPEGWGMMTDEMMDEMDAR